MNTSPDISYQERTRSLLRTSIARIEEEYASAARDRGALPAALLAAWGDLVDQLDLGPEPELCECPTCRHIGMRAATRCGFCWTHLVAPGDAQDSLTLAAE